MNLVSEPADPDLSVEEPDECDLSYQTDPVCPYCGNVDTDAWEIDFGPVWEGETDTTCNDCAEDYHVQREVSVTYSTKKIGGQ